MSEWRVTYQSVPFNYTSPSVFVVEAETPEVAFVTVYDALSRRGMSVYSRVPEGIDAAQVTAMGVTYNDGNVHIRKVEPYKIAKVGRIL